MSCWEPDMGHCGSLAARKLANAPYQGVFVPESQLLDLAQHASGSRYVLNTKDPQSGAKE